MEIARGCLVWRPKNFLAVADFRPEDGAAFERAFPVFPAVLRADAVETLLGMEAADPDGPWGFLIAAVKEYGEIELRMTF